MLVSIVRAAICFWQITWREMWLSIQFSRTVGWQQPSDSIQHSGNSINAERQDGPHPHSIVASPDNRFVYVPDLGTDRIVAYDFDAQSGNLTPNPRLTVVAPPGSGPRHIVFSPSGEFAYVSLELSSQVMVLAYKQGQLTEIGRYSTLPPSFDGVIRAQKFASHPIANTCTSQTAVTRAWPYLA